MAGNPMMLCGVLILTMTGCGVIGAPLTLRTERLSLDGWTDTESPFVPCTEDQECGQNFKCASTSWYKVDGNFPRICVPKSQSHEGEPPAFVTNLLAPGEPGRYNLYYCYYDKECPVGGVCKWVSKLASGICLYPDSKLDFTEFDEPPPAEQYKSDTKQILKYCSVNDECPQDHFCLNEEWMTNLGYLDYGVCMPKGFKYGPDNFPVHFQSEATDVQHRQADQHQRQAFAAGNAVSVQDPNAIVYCHSDMECPTGQYCLMGAWEGLFGKFDYGVCMPRSPAARAPCTMSSQCSQDEYCSYEGVCTAMFSNQPQAAGHVAPQAQPVPQAQPRLHYCKSSVECRADEYCLMRPESWKKFGSFDYGVCMPRDHGSQSVPRPPAQQPQPSSHVVHTRCTSFAQCGAGEYCTPDGRCLQMFINQPLAAANPDPGVMNTDPSQGPSKVIYCKSNRDCPAGGKCVMGEWTQFGMFDYGVCMPNSWRPSLAGNNLLLMPQSSDPSRSRQQPTSNQQGPTRYCTEDRQCLSGEFCMHGAWTQMGYYDYGVCMPMNTGLRSAGDDPSVHLRQSGDPGDGNVICTVCKDDNDCNSQDYCTAYLGSDDGLCWPRQGGPSPPKIPGSTICKQMTADAAKRCKGDRDCPSGQYCNTFLLSLNHQEGVCLSRGDAPAVVPPAQYQPVPGVDDSTLCNLCKTDVVCGSGFYCTAYLGGDDGVCWPRQGFGLAGVIPGKTVCQNGVPNLAAIALPAQAQPVATLSTPLGKVRCKLCTKDAECLSSEYCTAYKGTDQGLCWPDQGPMVPENLVPGVDLCSGTPDFKMCKSIADCNKETEYCTAYKGDDNGVCYPRLASIPTTGGSSSAALEAQAQPVAVIGESSPLTAVTGSAFACKLCTADIECTSTEYCTAYKGVDKGLCWPKSGVPGPPNAIPGESFCNYFGGDGKVDGDGNDIKLCDKDADCKVKEYCTAYMGNDKGVCWPVAVAAAQVPVAEIQFQPVPKPQTSGDDSKPASSTLCKLCKKQDECAIDEYCTAYLGNDEGICWPKINAPAFFPGISICPVKTTTPQMCKTDSECKGEDKYCTAFMGTDWGVCFPKEGGAMYKQDQVVDFHFEALVIDPDALAKPKLKEVASSDAKSDEESSDYFDTDKFLEKLMQ